MKVAILGGNGFIGKRFCELYSQKLDSLLVLSRQTVPLDDLEKLLEHTQNIDILVHAAFDHSYKSNQIGIKNILKACQYNNIQRLVYLSTISVYHADFIGELSENSPYSSLNDPYAKEKRCIEQLIEQDNNKNLGVVVLQPSIVYGLGGNWTKFVLHAAKASSISLPNAGEYICNAVFVDDVANAIFQACSSEVPSGKYLVSGNEPITWKTFYQAHAKLLQEQNYPSSLKIVANTTLYQYHQKFLIDRLFWLWFETPVGRIFDLMLVLLKKIRAKNYHSLNSKEELQGFLLSDTTKNNLSPLGITKKVHQCQFTVSIKKAKDLLDYRPQYNFQTGMRKISEQLQELK